ncbi:MULTISPECIES: alpha/beta fold hydrolase [unclassified Salinivibrio]|uniref:alpha/beta fold hydrolase n=1 Tax=unclassified Salinivibrio TaxID=2636825 RepID=UPI00128BD40E|nr:MULTISPECIES: alpha/beta fold hydrolase [unclassified Salinivibrio]MPS33570.1 alpha/beta fold hydrolase [Salinivibrio sp. VYel7]MPX94953.1 alpha/beta fold hydrolase [Salinivibrio sp. VYel9]MPX96658.1 alpha/beta fold hydrolase [Salinivibrio sp. VYel6]MPY00197.1 alpha/beta fold hydrolase [Salinivibrio sp. VYel4]MPY04299.1 alpha/beta fold hydrolase [Salinivibrio sp. VYel5]
MTDLADSNDQPAFDAHSLAREAVLSDAFKHHITPFWQQREQGYFHGEGGLRLHWCSFTRPQNRQAVVVVNGRIESVMKYQEIFYDLVQMGYDVYSFDHRGQGLSERLVIKPRDLGHVERFDDYVTDLATFMQFIGAHRQYDHTFMLAHSMGGAIAALYAHRFPHAIDGLAMTAPMFGVHVSPWLGRIAPWLCRSLARYQHPPRFGPGQVGYRHVPFEQNRLTHSRARYAWFRQLYINQPQLQIGGPSARWIAEGMAAAQHCLAIAPQLATPTLICQAGGEQIVSNPAMAEFHFLRRQANQPSQWQFFQGSRHEILFETDTHRLAAFTAIDDFFQRQSQH